MKKLSISLCFIKLYYTLPKIIERADLNPFEVNLHFTVIAKNFGEVNCLVGFGLLGLKEPLESVIPL